MDKEILPLVEGIANELLNQSLSFRYDICTCPRCKEAMLKRVTDEVSAIEVPLAQKSLEHVKDAYAKDISRLILHAVEHVSGKPPHLITEDRKKEFRRLLEKISSERGLDLRNYHTELLKRRIALRLQKNDIHSYAEYIKFLSQKPQEYDRLFETLCINVSEFLRDPPVWVTVRYLFENLIRIKQQNQDQNVKAWSAGCACGEEPYSVAMIFKEALRIVQAPVRLTIIATDIDKACLSAAPKASYPKDSLKNVNNKLLARYFELSEGKFVIKEELRSIVRFEYLDLTSQDYPQNLDVIFCRNVFIYFNRDLQKQILAKFYQSLKPGGYVVMGRSEAMSSEKTVFEIVDLNARIFCKVSPAAPPKH